LNARHLIPAVLERNRMIEPKRELMDLTIEMQRKWFLPVVI